MGKTALSDKWANCVLIGSLALLGLVSGCASPGPARATEARSAAIGLWDVLVPMCADRGEIARPEVGQGAHFASLYLNIVEEWKRAFPLNHEGYLRGQRQGYKVAHLSDEAEKIATCAMVAREIGVAHARLLGEVPRYYGGGSSSGGSSRDSGYKHTYVPDRTIRIITD